MKRAWGQLAGCLMSAALFGGVAEHAGRGGHTAAAAALGVTAAALVLLALIVKRADCPRCGRPLIFTDYAWCPRCLEYYLPAGRFLGPVSDLTVASAPRFVAQFKRLKPPDKWVWPDADACAVCGRAATRFLKITLDASVDGRPWPAFGDVAPEAVVAHCDTHEAGVGVGTEPGEEARPRAGVSFRSYRLWRRFQQLNLRSAGK